MKTTEQIFVKDTTYNGIRTIIMGIVTMPGMKFSLVRRFSELDFDEKNEYFEYLKSITKQVNFEGEE